jgi:hypothetical protein
VYFRFVASSFIAIGGGEAYGENCEVFDCSNTVSSYQGDRCGAFSNPTLRSVAVVEYLYHAHWPCSNGCNLCGDSGRMTMGTSNFTYPSLYLKSNVSIQCYDLQYDALTGGLSRGDYCLTFPPLVEDLCGCEISSVGVPVETPTIDPPVDTPVETPTAPAPTTLAPLPTAGAISMVHQGVLNAGMLMAAAFVWAW